MLRVNNLVVRYGTTLAVNNVSLEVRPGEIVSIVGGNGAGKTTVAKTIAGLLKPANGNIELCSDGLSENLSVKPAWAIARSGIIYVPETKPVFEKLTVEENLKVALASIRLKKEICKDLLSKAFTDFPLLQERLTQIAGTLSGGQKRMLAIAKAVLFMNALGVSSLNAGALFRLLILDEPTHGLHPQSINAIGDLLRRLNATGISILLVEQMATFALGLSRQGYLMRQGTIITSGDSKELLHNPALADLYLGLTKK